MIPLVVLVRTHSPGNIGACARACRCFGAELLLVEPRADRGHVDARAFASGAEALLDAAPVIEGLHALPRLAARVLALTAARARTARGLPPETSFEDAAASRDRVALVFGPERGGLTTDELRRCDATLSIATRPEFPTLSLPQAVAATLALLAAPRTLSRAEPATTAELERLFDVLRQALSGARWPRAGRSPEAVAEIESLLKRARPTPREAGLLMGALAALRKGNEEPG